MIETRAFTAGKSTATQDGTPGTMLMVTTSGTT